jgi:hypothetical protein
MCHSAHPVAAIGARTMAKQGSIFFFEKKKQKTLFYRASTAPAKQPTSLMNQKFFGSFFQKRTASFLTTLP